MKRAAIAMVVIAGCAGPPAAPGAVTDGAVVVATFTDARALSVDGTGRLYIADAGGVVIVDTLIGARPAAIGSGSERLVDVADIDATNGLEWFVADAAGGRVLRVSHDGRLLEDTPVPADAPPAGLAPAIGGPRGRPVAVAAGSGGALFVAEASRGSVLRWDDASRRRLRAIGGRDAASGGLVDPVGLAVGPDGTLAVADAGRRAILLFDAFGSLERTIDVGSARAVWWTRRERIPMLLVIGDRTVTLLSREGAETDRRAYDLGGEELVDALETTSARWLLTPTRLLRVTR